MPEYQCNYQYPSSAIASNRDDHLAAADADVPGVIMVYGDVFADGTAGIGVLNGSASAVEAYVERWRQSGVTVTYQEVRRLFCNCATS